MTPLICLIALCYSPEDKAHLTSLAADMGYTCVMWQDAGDGYVRDLKVGAPVHTAGAHSFRCAAKNLFSVELLEVESFLDGLGCLADGGADTSEYVCDRGVPRHVSEIE